MRKILSIIGLLTVFLFSVMFGEISAIAASNNSIQTAQNIALNTAYKGTINNNSSSYKDYYKFHVNTNGKVSIKMNRQPGVSWRLSLINKENERYATQLTKWDSNAEGKEVIEVGLASGDYYIAIENFHNSLGVSYQFEVDFASGDYFEKEFNDTLLASNNIKLNQEYEGISENSYDKDYYKFNLSSPGNVKLDFSRKPGYYWNVAILNSEGESYLNFVTSADSDKLGNEQQNIGLPAGTYYIRVTSSSGNRVPYKFKVNYSKSEYYEKEFNDSVSTANEISLNKQYKGANSSYGDKDYFKFKINKKTKIVASILKNSSANWHVSMIDNNGNNLLSFYSLDSDGEDTIELKPGVYYVKIDINYNGNIPYTFKIQEATKRIAGPTRYETAVEISKEGWNKSDNVVLARGNNFPDALAGGPLAQYYKAPILLTNGKKLTAVSKKEIQRLKAKKVVLLGGEGAISNGVASELKKMGVTVERVGGKNRYETAAAIAKKIPSTKVVVANGKSFADALAVAPYASKNQMPILLTDPKKLPTPTKNAIKGKKSTIVVGGKGAVSDTVMSKLPAPKRYGGATRYDTAKIIVQQLPLGKEIGYVATGKSFPDALAGSSLAAKNNAPLLLVDPKYIPSQTKSVMTGFTKYGVWGGPSAVSEKTVNELNGKVTPIK